MASPSSTPVSQIIRLSQRNEPADLDPATSSLVDDFFVIRALSEGLLAPSAEGNTPLPAAAERWDVSSDGLVYTFHLRRDAKWSNGEPVVADDFVASYQRLLAPATAAPKAHLFFAVKNARPFTAGEIHDFSTVGFHAANSHALVITLERPMPRFPLYVASGPWIPINPRVVAKHSRNWTRPENFVGNGAFTLAEWRPHQRIVVKKNPTFHSAAGVRLDEIHFIVFDNSEAEEYAFRTGQIDVTMAVPPSKFETYTRERPNEIHRAPLAETRFLSFNTLRPPLDNPAVRRALALALDRQKIVDRVRRGGQQPAFRFVPDALRPRNAHGVRVPPQNESWALSFDPEEARVLLASAGFPSGKNFPRLELTGWAHTPVLEVVQEMWRQELGIEVAIGLREAKVHLSALNTGSYDIAFLAQIPDVADPADLLADFVTGAPGNYPHWSDARYNELLTAAAAEPNPSRQASLLHDAEKRLVEVCPVTPLYFNAKNWLMSSRVRGWNEDPLWTRNYQNLRLDEN